MGCFPSNPTGVLLIHIDVSLPSMSLCAHKSTHLLLKSESELQEDRGKSPLSLHRPCQWSYCMWSRPEGRCSESVKPKKLLYLCICSGCFPFGLEKLKRKKIIGEKSRHQSFSNAKTFGTPKPNRMETLGVLQKKRWEVSGNSFAEILTAGPCNLASKCDTFAWS